MFVSFISSTSGATCGAGTSYSSGSPKITPVFCRVRVSQSFVLWIIVYPFSSCIMCSSVYDFRFMTSGYSLEQKLIQRYYMLLYLSNVSNNDNTAEKMYFFPKYYRISIYFLNHTFNFSKLSNIPILINKFFHMCSAVSFISSNVWYVSMYTIYSQNSKCLTLKLIFNKKKQQKLFINKIKSVCSYKLINLPNIQLTHSPKRLSISLTD